MAGENCFVLGIDQIRKFLPHDFPFLLVDRILDIKQVAGDVGTSVVAIKNVTFNEPCFQGHFPEYSILPGVLILESMAQAASFSLYPELVKTADMSMADFQCILLGVNGARFRRPVIPGDTLRLESVVTKRRGKLWIFDVTASVDGQRAAEAELMTNIVRKS